MAEDKAAILELINLVSADEEAGEPVLALLLI